ncbi:MAG: hypothetical protein GWN55_09855 [Phycisphaerae bacterium]|nr:hypothetical protein [Phycisphaerae bacterium]NIS51521.1 hypothetical protein [Phycisphaerae bacterium]NIV01608.1 hypothetical protein [Phycisphaerae bacterium]NIW97762.1 hypothetical protein [Phycisphaerae bacterium]NIX26438.1 hypothetical protein [Phycisphaerae bacterium]
MATSVMYLNYLLQDIKESFRLLAEIDERYVFDNTGHFDRREEDIFYFPQLCWGWTFDKEDD